MARLAAAIDSEDELPDLKDVIAERKTTAIAKLSSTKVPTKLKVRNQSNIDVEVSADTQEWIGGVAVGAANPKPKRRVLGSKADNPLLRPLLGAAEQEKRSNARRIIPKPTRSSADKETGAFPSNTSLHTKGGLPFTRPIFDSGLRRDRTHSSISKNGASRSPTTVRVRPPRHRTTADDVERDESLRALDVQVDNIYEAKSEEETSGMSDFIVDDRDDSEDGEDSEEDIKPPPRSVRRLVRGRREERVQLKEDNDALGALTADIVDLTITPIKTTTRTRSHQKPDAPGRVQLDLETSSDLEELPPTLTLYVLIGAFQSFC